MGGKLWLMWKHEVNFVVHDMGDQFITFSMLENLNTILVTVVYAKCYYQERRRLWNYLEDMITNNMPWIVLGDFNIIRNDM